MHKVTYINPTVCFEHDTGPGHPERIARLEAINLHLSECGLRQDLEEIEARRASREEIAAVHEEMHIDRVTRRIEAGFPHLDGDTTVSELSLEAAYLAAGAALTGVERLKSGASSRVFCAVRPPGHHAEAGRAMGFCIFNNAAVAAAAALSSGLAKRVLILDWDVHHGNGTQHIFETSPDVFYYSLHQFPFYPGTGSAGETGRDAGRDTTLNRPLDPGTSEETYFRLLEHDLDQIGLRFKPELIIVSAGFDAHKDDPLGAMLVTDKGFGRMTRMVTAAADTLCHGRVLSLLEGGYDLRALAYSVEQHLAALADA